MRALIFLVLSAICCIPAMPSCAALKTPAEWKFNTDGDTAGWQVSSHVEGLTAKGGYLVGHVTGGDPSVAGPRFEIVASPYQFVEISMRTTASGTGEVFWTNTSEEPYGGFRPNLMHTIDFKAGDFQVYRIFPLWQDLGKIVRLRIDPPQKSDFEIEYVKVVEIEVPTSTSALFDFTKAGQVWYSADNPEGAPSPDGVAVKTPGDWMLFSPRLNLDSSASPFVGVLAKSDGAEEARLRWITDGSPGDRSYPVKLRPDGRWHMYNIPVGDMPDWVGHIKTLVLDGTLLEGQQLRIKSAGASDKPTGPAELEIRNFRLRDAVNRVDPKKPAVLQAELVNTGGAPVNEEITARFTIGPDNKLDISPLDLPSAVGLKPGASMMMTFHVVASHPGSSDVRLTVENKETTASQSASPLWYGPVNVTASSYVPEPKPVRGDFEVGMYYFPGWNTYRAWSVLNDFPERRPLLGYYREGEAEVADWQIKWMVEHGVTFIVYDWYWSAGGRSLEHGIHQGYFNAKYHDKIKFCLLWANHNAPKTSSAEDMVNVTNYWLDNYFLRPDYFKVDGKPVVVIFSAGRLTDDLGADGVRQAFDKARDMAKARGLAGIYFVACTYPNAGYMKVMEQEGYDALSGYNYPSAGDKGQVRAPYADMVTGYQDWWNAIADSTKLRYIPVTEPGWDSRPWHGPDARARTGKTPALFKQMLENAKAFVEKRTPNASPKMVLVEAWNEFGEGDYVEPNAGFGFGHLDAIREVFTNAPKQHDDIVPQDVGLALIEVEKPKPVTSWEFNDPKSPGWDAQMGLTDVKLADGSLSMLSTTGDPALTASMEDLDSRKVSAVEIRMKVDKGGTGQLFWSGLAWGFIESAAARFDLKADGQFHTYRIDLSKTPTWKSKITGFRFDPTDATGASISIDFIRLVKR